MDKDVINFFDRNAEYGFMSNFYPSPFTIANKTYPTSEHYFQSQKFAGLPYELEIIAAPTSDDAFELGRSREHPLRADWAQVKEEVMYEGIRNKIVQNPELRKRLLETGDRKIVEHTEEDSYWGDGGDGSGQNRLGVLYMKLRE